MKNSLIEIIKETYMNVCEEGTHNYKKLKEKDFEIIAEDILDSDEFWNMLDMLILDELNINYEK